MFKHYALYAITVCISIFSQHSYTFPISATAYYHQKLNRCIILLGDYHATSAEQPEEAQILPLGKTWFENLINNQQFRIYVEGYPEVFQAYQAYPVHTMPLMQQCWQESQLNGHTNNKYFTYDARTGVIGSLTNLHFNYPSITQQTVQAIQSLLEAKKETSLITYLNKLLTKYPNNSSTILHDILFSAESQSLHEKITLNKIREVFFTYAQKSDVCWDTNHTLATLDTDIKNLKEKTEKLHNRTILLKEKDTSLLTALLVKKAEEISTCHQNVNAHLKKEHFQTNSIYENLWNYGMQKANLSTAFGHDTTSFTGLEFKHFL